MKKVSQFQGGLPASLNKKHLAKYNFTTDPKPETSSFAA